MVERFENLVAWQKARVLAQTVYKMTRERTFAKDIGLSSQIQRAAYPSWLILQRALNEIVLENSISFCLLQKAPVPRFDLTSTPHMMLDTSNKIASQNYSFRLKKWDGLSEG